MPGGGALRERVTFQRQGAGAGDGMGNYGSGFADLANCINVPASLTPLRHGEVALAEGVQGRVLYRVELRYTATLAGIGVGDRMVDARDATRIFNIVAPAFNPDKKKRYLQIQAQLGGASG
jgi:hypothetical protein